MNTPLTDSPAKPPATPRRDLPEWRRYRYPQSLIHFGVLLGALVFLGYSLVHMDVRLERLLNVFGRLYAVLADRYYPPDVAFMADGGFLDAVLESAQMAYLGALFGLALSVPLAWCAAFNVTPSRRFLYPLARLLVIGSRSVHEMIWTILFVNILGFGMLAGVLALTMFCVGFAGKLFAEEVEAIDRGPVEAMRATGANEFKVFIFAVLPQVRVAWTGIAIYTWDVAFRAATVVGFFGAGGIGWHLQRYVQQLDNQRVAAILLAIVGLVVIAEVISAWARRRVAASS